MKKALTIALLALTAVSMQAATIKWMSGTVTASNGSQANADSNIVTGYLYLVDKTTWDNFNAATDTATYLKEDGTPKMTASASATSSKKGNVDISTTAEQSDGTQYAIVFYVDNTGKVKATKGSDFINSSNVAAGTGSGGLASNSYASANWAPVPEPTAVALIALGLAALGLKRKVA